MLQDRIREALDDLSTGELIDIGLTLANEGYLDREDVWEPLDVYDIWSSYVDSSDDFETFLDAAARGDFNTGNDFWRWSMYGPESTDDPDFDLDFFAETIADNTDARWARYLPDEITDVIDGEDEDDDSEDETVELDHLTFEDVRDIVADELQETASDPKSAALVMSAAYPPTVTLAQRCIDEYNTQHGEDPLDPADVLAILHDLIRNTTVCEAPAEEPAEEPAPETNGLRRGGRSKRAARALAAEEHDHALAWGELERLFREHVPFTIPIPDEEVTAHVINACVGFAFQNDGRRPETTDEFLQAVAAQGWAVTDPELPDEPAIA